MKRNSVWIIESRFADYAWTPRDFTFRELAYPEKDGARRAKTLNERAVGNWTYRVVEYVRKENPNHRT